MSNSNSSSNLNGNTATNQNQPSNNTRNIPHYSDKGQYPDSYYAASRNPKPNRPTLKNDIQVEICVVGGGYSGLSTALHLIETDHEVVVLEGAQIGWGFQFQSPIFVLTVAYLMFAVGLSLSGVFMLGGSIAGVQCRDNVDLLG